MPKVFIKRGTRAQLNAAAVAGGLNAGELYLVIDENLISVGASISSYFDLTASALVVFGAALIFSSTDNSMYLPNRA